MAGLSRVPAAVNVCIDAVQRCGLAVGCLHTAAALTLCGRRCRPGDAVEQPPRRVKV
jgi:hypothetical protein